MADIKPILVNEKTYKVQKLDVLETIYLHAEAMHLMGDLVGSLLDLFFRMMKGENVQLPELGTTLAKADPEAIKKLTPLIFKQVITPENTFLADAVTINEWFSRPENKDDVWEVLILATGTLLGEYLPAFLKGMITKREKPAQ